MQADFTQDSRFAIFPLSDDSLCILDLLTKQERYIASCLSYKLAYNKFEDWIAYQVRDQQLILRNLRTDKSVYFTDVEDYQFNNKGDALLMKGILDTEGMTTLTWFRIPSQKQTMLWRGKEISNVAFDATGSKLVFIGSTELTIDPEKEIWYYSDSMNKAALLLARSNSFWRRIGV